MGLNCLYQQGHPQAPLLGVDRLAREGIEQEISRHSTHPHLLGDLLSKRLADVHPDHHQDLAELLL